MVEAFVIRLVAASSSASSKLPTRFEPLHYEVQHAGSPTRPTTAWSVLLAGLALAEGDRETATTLVLDSGTGSGWACIMADNFARRLDLMDERRRRIVDAIRSRDSANNLGRAATALGNELV